MSADPRYHVKINGKGYVLIDESYAVQPQRPFNPRFSTGDPSLGDLSFWQFLGQDLFDGGEGQEIFSVTNKIKSSGGWDFRDGKPRLSFGLKAPSSYTANPIAHIGYYMCQPKVVFFANAIHIIYPMDTATLAALGRRQIKARADGYPDIWIVNAMDGIVMRRDSASGAADDHLMLVHSKTLRSVDSAFATVTDITLTHYGTSLGIASTPANTIVVGGNRGTGTFPAANGQPTFTRIALTAGAFTAATTKELILDGLITGEACSVLSGSAVDSNGTMYFCIRDTTTAAAGLLLPSRIVRIVAGDLTATEFAISAIDELPNLRPHGLAALNGSVYIFGLRQTGAGSGYQEVTKYPNTPVWRSEKIHTNLGSEPSVAFMPMQPGPLEILFVADHGQGNGWASVYSLRQDDTVSEKQGLVPYVMSGSAIANRYMSACWESDGLMYFYNATQGLLYRTGSTRGFGIEGALNSDQRVSNAVASTVSLKFSRQIGGTTLIDKSLFKFVLEISEALPTDGTIAIYVNDTLAGTMTASDGTRFLFAPPEVSSAYFDVRLEATASMRWDGYLVAYTLQYIPTQLKKLAWGFAVRATKSLKLLNGQFEERAPEKIVADLKSAWAANTPLEFMDIDGETYSAIVTEFKARMPLAADKTKDREFLVSLELLEV